MNALKSALSGIFHFYADGFRKMPDWGKKSWLIIILKLFILFVVLRIFFFPDILKKNFSSDRERSEYVLNRILTSNK